MRTAGLDGFVVDRQLPHGERAIGSLLGGGPDIAHLAERLVERDRRLSSLRLAEHTRVGALGDPLLVSAAGEVILGKKLLVRLVLTHREGPIRLILGYHLGP